MLTANDQTAISESDYHIDYTTPLAPTQLGTPHRCISLRERDRGPAQSVIASCSIARSCYSLDKKPGQRRPSRSEATYRGQAGYAESRLLGFDTLRYSTGARSPGFAHDGLFLSRSSFCDEAIPFMVEIASHKPLAMTLAPKLKCTSPHHSAIWPRSSKPTSPCGQSRQADTSLSRRRFRRANYPRLLPAR